MYTHILSYQLHLNLFFPTGVNMCFLQFMEWFWYWCSLLSIGGAVSRWDVKPANTRWSFQQSPSSSSREYLKLANEGWHIIIDTVYIYMCMYTHKITWIYQVWAYICILQYIILLCSSRQTSQWYIHNLKMYLLLHLSDFKCDVGALEGKTYLFWQVAFWDPGWNLTCELVVTGRAVESRV